MLLKCIVLEAVKLVPVILYGNLCLWKDLEQFNKPDLFTNNRAVTTRDCYIGVRSGINSRNRTATKASELFYCSCY